MNSKSNSALYMIGAFVALVVGVVLFTVREQAQAPITVVLPSVETGTGSSAPAPAPVVKKTTAQPIPPPLPVPVVKETLPTITYTASGFSPSVLEVERGKTVRFVNRTTLSMRLMSNRDGGLNPYPAFDQTKSVGQYGVYEFTFTLPGTWSFKNQYDTKAVGVVVVK